MTAQLSLIEAHERTINQIFSDTYAFEIPSYQRPYAWEEQQARELLTDLLDAMDSGEDVYFPWKYSPDQIIACANVAGGRRTTAINDPNHFAKHIAGLDSRRRGEAHPPGLRVSKG